MKKNEDNLSLVLWPSVQFSRSVLANSLWPHGLQHARPPCLSPTPELAQTHVCRVSDAIQPSHTLLSPSPSAYSLSNHQGLFKWVSSSHHLAKILEFQLQHQSFQWTFRSAFLLDGLVGSPCSSRDSQESSPTSQFKSVNSWVLSFLIVQLSHPHMTTGKATALTSRTFVSKVMSLCFNMLSRLVITFLPRSKHLLISWVQ